MMKTLITHINPHLDDIAAVWLFNRFHSEFKDAKIEFISASAGNIKADQKDGKVYIGVGRGLFDEHKGDVEDCAASLVWKYLKGEKLEPKDQIVGKSVEEIVEWVRLGDLGKLPQQQYDDFSVPAFIRPKGNQKEESEKAVLLGEDILDRILRVLNRKNRSLKDWQKAIVFTSKFGKSYAIKSENVDRAFCAKQGGDLYLMYDPYTKYVQFFTPSFKIDLEPIYLKVVKLDPKASWFLHQSHHMVICGSSSAPDSYHTNLSFEQLIKVVQSFS